MKDFLLLLIMIFPFIWIIITCWTMVTKNTQHWLYKSWLWLHWFILSFLFIIYITNPVVVKYLGLLIPIHIWGLSKILKSLGEIDTRYYTIYNIIITLLTIFITFSTTKNIDNYEPGLFTVFFAIFYLIISYMFVYKLFHKKN